MSRPTCCYRGSPKRSCSTRCPVPTCCRISPGIWKSSRSQVHCCFTSTETIRAVSDREPRTSTSTFKQLLRSETGSPVPTCCYRGQAWWCSRCPVPTLLQGQANKDGAVPGVRTYPEDCTYFVTEPGKETW